MDTGEFEIDLSDASPNPYVHSQQSVIEQTLAQAEDEIELDLTHAPSEVYPDVPVWAENESKDLFQLFSSQSIDKARVLVNRGLLDEVADGLWSVLGSEVYMVTVIENPYGGVPWTTCTCPNGQNRASRPTCYHSAAALMKVLEIDTDPDDVKTD